MYAIRSYYADGAEDNPSHDTDGDGLINVLDPDSDGDGLFDGTDGDGVDLAPGHQPVAVGPGGDAQAAGLDRERHGELSYNFV